MKSYGAAAWKKAPFIRLFIPLALGILVQFYWQIPILILWIITLFTVAFISLSFFKPLFQRFRYNYYYGFAINFIFFSFGALLISHKDMRNNIDWIGRMDLAPDFWELQLLESPIEKARSIKANCAVLSYINNNWRSPAKGKVILYLEKDSNLLQLEPGTRVSINQPLDNIRSSGNPGAFNFRRYSLLKGISHQAFVKKNEYIIGRENGNYWQTFVSSARKKVLHILRSYIRPAKEQGLAEALLIGYKDDLDPEILQSYTNTGVVHIIAVSGLHLGLVYALLQFLLKPLSRIKRFKWIAPLLTIIGLWLFSIIAGAQPSVLRSALMFSCLVAGDAFSKRSSVFNSLAFSAFLLLCINPFWLWDIGFQLSYAAVLSIMIFVKPIYNLFYIKNNLLDLVWKLNAVTIAAQIITIPFCLYHFHQFPNYFLLANLLAVPLSSLILIGEIFLCMISGFPALALVLGSCLGLVISCMNHYIKAVEILPFSTWEGIQLNLVQVILLFVLITTLYYWIERRNSKFLLFSLSITMLILCFRLVSFYECEKQQKLIVYNTPGLQAIDFIKGREHYFLANQPLSRNQLVYKFHIQPAQILYRLKPAKKTSPMNLASNFIRFGSLRIIYLDETTWLPPTSEPIVLDLLIVSGFNRSRSHTILKSILPRQVVFDGTTRHWKIKEWKILCDSIGIKYHDVSKDGAFVMTAR